MSVTTQKKNARKVSKGRVRRSNRGVSVKAKAAKSSTVVTPLPFYAKIQVKPLARVPAEVVGKFGVVVGRAQTHGRWNYSVMVEGFEESYSLPHASLVPTGVILKREDLYGGERIKVRVDASGAGTVVGDAGVE